MNSQKRKKSMVESTYSHFCNQEYGEASSAFEAMNKAEAYLHDKY
jgi:hypothetical protein